MCKLKVVDSEFEEHQWLTLWTLLEGKPMSHLTLLNLSSILFFAVVYP